MIKPVQKPESDSAWAELRATVHRFVARRVRDTHTADDIAQNVMLKVKENLSSVPPGERLAAWVFRVARNAVTDHYRASAQRDYATIDDAADLAGEQPEENALRDLSQCVGGMTRHLREPYREALQLADLEEMGHQEVADKLGITLPAAKSRVQRAREKLHDLLLDCCEFEQNRRGGVVDYRTTSRSARYCGGDPEPGACA